MKTHLQTSKRILTSSLIVASLCGGVTFHTRGYALGAEVQGDLPKDAISTGGSGGASQSGQVVLDGRTGTAIVSDGNTMQVRPLRAGGRLERQEVIWLGAAVEEAPEALAAQLGLDPGAGLVVTYVATNSPAARVGLQKNDVLVELDGQSLVLPAQLRKLVQVRKEGDTVRLVFYRAGKKHTVSPALGKTTAGLGFADGESAWPRYLEFQQRLGDLPMAESLRELGAKIDQTKIRDEIRRSMDEARRAYEEALRHATNLNSELAPLRRELESLARSKVFLDKDASVTVRSTGGRTKSIVNADESGTLVIVSNPKPHLTAHDKDGKLLFDGEIDTPEQQAKVPVELWNKVKPLVKKVAPSAGNESETRSEPTEESAPGKW